MEDALRELAGLPTLLSTAALSAVVEESKTQAPPDANLGHIIPAVTLDEDFAFVRQSLHDVVEIGTDALANAAAIARESEHPHAFEVLAGIISAVTNSATSILVARQKKALIEQTTSGEKSDGGDKSHFHIEKAAFVGSTSDLQKVFSARKPYDIPVVQVESTDEE